MGRRPPRYSDEYKQVAIRRVLTDGESARAVAQDLGCDPSTLRGWVQAARSAQETPASMTEQTNPAAEIARLRRENAQLRMERDILKKAVSIVSQMHP